MPMRLVPLLALAGAVALGGSGAEAQANHWTPGNALPDLRLPTIDGGTAALSDFRGKKLLLIEFASW